METPSDIDLNDGKRKKRIIIIIAIVLFVIIIASVVVFVLLKLRYKEKERRQQRIKNRHILFKPKSTSSSVYSNIALDMIEDERVKILEKRYKNQVVVPSLFDDHFKNLIWTVSQDKLYWHFDASQIQFTDDPMNLGASEKERIFAYHLKPKEQRTLASPGELIASSLMAINPVDYAQEERSGIPNSMTNFMYTQKYWIINFLVSPDDKWLISLRTNSNSRNIDRLYFNNAPVFWSFHRLVQPKNSLATLFSINTFYTPFDKKLEFVPIDELFRFSPDGRYLCKDKSLLLDLHHPERGFFLLPDFDNRADIKQQIKSKDSGRPCFDPCKTNLFYQPFPVEAKDGKKLVNFIVKGWDVTLLMTQTKAHSHSGKYEDSTKSELTTTEVPSSTLPLCSVKIEVGINIADYTNTTCKIELSPIYVKGSSHFRFLYLSFYVKKSEYLVHLVYKVELEGFSGALFGPITLNQLCAFYVVPGTILKKYAIQTNNSVSQIRWAVDLVSKSPCIYRIEGTCIHQILIQLHSSSDLTLDLASFMKKIKFQTEIIAYHEAEKTLYDVNNDKRGKMVFAHHYQEHFFFKSNLEGALEDEHRYREFAFLGPEPKELDVNNGSPVMILDIDHINCIAQSINLTEETKVVKE